MLETLERQSAGTPLTPLKPEFLGDESFRRDHRLRYAYVAGAMANGIASTRLVGEMAGAGMLGFFGAAGLGLERIESAIDELARTHPGAPYGFNLSTAPTSRISKPAWWISTCDAESGWWRPPPTCGSRCRWCATG